MGKIISEFQINRKRKKREAADSNNKGSKLIKQSSQGDAVFLTFLL